MPKIKKKVKKVTFSRLKELLWDEVRHYIYRRDPNICITCKRKHLSGTDRQAGHCIPRSTGGVALYFNPLNIAVQCSHCNGAGDGEGALFADELGMKHCYNVLWVLQKVRLDTKNWDWNRKDIEAHLAWFKSGGENYDEYYAAWLENALKTRNKYGVAL